MNLPNKISLCRILIIPLFVFFYLATFIPYGKLIAMLLFAIACFTDFLDGHIARSRNMVTNLGKFLDSIADKVLIMAGIILLVAVPITANGGTRPPEPAIFPTYIGAVIAIVVLGREFIISALRQIAAAKNVILAADIYGKVKAVFQFITLIYYFAYAFIVEEFYYAIQGTAHTVICLIGYILLAATIILTLVSAGKYLASNKQVFKDEK